MSYIKRLIATVLVSMLILSQLVVANAVTMPNSINPQPTAPLKKALPQLSGISPAKSLALAEKYYKLALSKATSDEKRAITLGINWKPDFTGKTKDAARVRLYNYQSVFITNYTDLKGLYLALDSALFALDTTNAISAGNFASAIIAYSEDTVKKPMGLAIKDVKPYAEDAAAVYEYALSLKLSAQFINADSLPLLLNYGYVCLDMGKLPVAKILFETAVKISPDYLTAKEGMAAYWIAAGDKNKAKKALEGTITASYFKNMKKMSEETTETKAPQVVPGDDLQTTENKINTLKVVPVVLATDFYSNLDPEGTTKVTKFVDSLAASVKYAAPEYKYLLQYSPLKNFMSGGGQAAFNAFLGQMNESAKMFSVAKVSENQQAMDSMGLKIEGLNIDDMMKNPEKYKDFELSDQAKIDLIGSIMDKAGQLEEKAMKAEDDLENGNVDSALAIGASVDPSLIIFQMKPGNYANPTDVGVQKYNMTVLNKKLTAYENYFRKQNEDQKKVLEEDSIKLGTKVPALEKAMEDELEQLAKEHGASHKAETSQCNPCILKKHAIHSSYDPQLNNLSETTWMDATNFVNGRYLQKVKPKIEEMYKECMENCMLISDKKVRKIKEDKVVALVYQSVFESMQNIAVAYSTKPQGYPFSCNCSEEEIEAAKEKERQAFREEQARKREMEIKAKAAFDAGTVNENSQLYQRLDKYSANLNMMFMKGKWHPLQTEVTFGIKSPFKQNDADKTTLEAAATLKIIENHIVNTTTYKGGLYATAGVSDSTGALGVKGTLGVQGEVTTNQSGNVTYADVSGVAQASATAGWVKATGSYEASVMRGCKFSGEVAQVYNDSLKPAFKMTATDKSVWNQVTNAGKTFLPEKPKKVLWKGEYKLDE